MRESPRLGLSSALHGCCAVGVLCNEPSVWGPISTGKLHSRVVDGKTQTLADRNPQETVSLLQSPKILSHPWAQEQATSIHRHVGKKSRTC